jgi:hypothetical protein
MTMTPKEELIQVIEQSPDELVQALLELFRVIQRTRSPNASETVQQKTVLERMGGAPKQMLSVGDLSDRDRRRDLIATHLQKQHGRG